MKAKNSNESFQTITAMVDYLSLQVEWRTIVVIMIMIIVEFEEFINDKYELTKSSNYEIQQIFFQITYL